LIYGFDKYPSERTAVFIAHLKGNIGKGKTTGLQKAFGRLDTNPF